MPRLTDILLKGGARHPTNTHKKMINYVKTHSNHRVMTLPVLGNKVNLTNPSSKDSDCIEEMQIMLTCMKQHDFKEGSCMEESKMFTKCSSASRIRKAEQKKISASDELGVVGPDGKLNPRQLNKLLAMYPQPPHKIVLSHNFHHKYSQPVVYDRKPEENSILTAKFSPKL